MASTFAPRLQGLRAKVLRRHQHRPLVWLLLGLYGCRWRRCETGSVQARTRDCCCSKLEGVTFGLLAAACCLALVFLYFWGQAKNDYNDFDWWVDKTILFMEV